MKAKTNYRYRLTFRKDRPVKYVGHLDTVLTWTRAFRRAQIPLAYSQGFNPNARIQVAASLPLGYIGREELMDIFLQEPMDPDEICSRVGSTLPPGFDLLAVQKIEPDSPGLQQSLKQADYHVIVETDLPETELNRRIQALLAAEEVIQTRIRRKKEEWFNLRPLLHNLKLKERHHGDVTLVMRLSAGQHGHLRPESVLQALALGDIWFEVERTKLIFSI